MIVGFFLAIDILNEGSNPKHCLFSRQTLTKAMLRTIKRFRQFTPNKRRRYLLNLSLRNISPLTVRVIHLPFAHGRPNKSLIFIEDPEHMGVHIFRCH